MIRFGSGLGAKRIGLDWTGPDWTHLDSSGKGVQAVVSIYEGGGNLRQFFLAAPSCQYERHREEPL